MTHLFAMTALLVALSTPLTVADGDGTVLVYQASRRRWLAIDRCERGVAQLAWVKDVLFISCRGRPLSRWSASHGGAVEIESAVLSQMRPRLIAGGSDLYLVEGKAVWRYRVAFDLLERIAQLPGPVRWVLETRAGLMVGDCRGWIWRSRRWARAPAPGQGISAKRCDRIATPID